jgi:hypothetical protein
MAMKKITIEVDLNDGKITVDRDGWVGKSCLADTKFLEDILGAPSKQVFKDAFRKVEAVKIGR